MLLSESNYNFSKKMIDLFGKPFTKIEKEEKIEKKEDEKEDEK